MKSTGRVYLVGAGPGDPDLITHKGRMLLARADVVLYDHLANEALLDLAPAQAERIYVGKKKSTHSHTQEEICALLINRAQGNKTVVRLKGGDPYIFGRGGEEAEALADAGVAFEVVPGVTSPLGIAAYTGVPLTHRDHTSVVTFVTGHHPEAIDWARVGHAETLVIYMGLTSMREIARRLMENGRGGATPAMAVRWGTRTRQQTVVGTLGDIADRIEGARMKPPATIVIGEVVGLRDKLSWFEKLPLFGQTVVVTRAAGQAGELSAKLRALGAEAIEMPVIAIEPAADPEALDQAIAELESYDWVIFTSANGVRFFLDRLDGSARDLRALRARLCAIGPATGKALEALHLKVDLMPAEFVAESLLVALAKFPLAGKKILLPRAAVARDLIPEELAKRGAQVNVVEAYRTIMPHAPTWNLEQANWVTFTSSSTVNHFVALMGAEALRGVRIASIGPVTSETIRSHGFQVDVQARVYTLDGLVEALVEAVPLYSGRL